MKSWMYMKSDGIAWKLFEQEHEKISYITGNVLYSYHTKFFIMDGTKCSTRCG